MTNQQEKVMGETTKGPWGTRGLSKEQRARLHLLAPQLRDALEELVSELERERLATLYEKIAALDSFRNARTILEKVRGK